MRSFSALVLGARSRRSFSALVLGARSRRSFSALVLGAALVAALIGSASLVQAGEHLRCRS